MLLNAVIDSILPIDSIWRESSIAIEQMNKAEDVSRVVSDTTLGLSALILVVILLLLGDKILKALPILFNSIFFSKDIDKLENDSHSRNVLHLMLLISCPLIIAILYQFNFETVTYLISLSILYLWFVVRYAILEAIDIITSDKHLFRYINRIYILYFISATAICLLPILFITIYNGISPNIVKIVFYSIWGSLFMFYIFFVGKTIISKGVPLFFSFLYLCTLELLPTALLVGALEKI